VNEESRLAVRRGLTATNTEQSAEMRSLYSRAPAEPPRVEVYVTDESGAVLGGAYGVILWGRWFDPDVVWLGDAVRGGGTGRMLMQKVEGAAREAGASAVRLDPLDFQACGFYEKCGYRVYGELAGYPEHHTQYLMTKEL